MVRIEVEFHEKHFNLELYYYGTYNSYLPVIEVHEMHGRMHPNYWQITILLVVDLCSSLAYFMMTQPLPITSKLPIKTLVAQQLPTSMYIHVYIYSPHRYFTLFPHLHVYTYVQWCRQGGACGFICTQSMHLCTQFC